MEVKGEIPYPQMSPSTSNLSNVSGTATMTGYIYTQNFTGGKIYEIERMYPTIVQYIYVDR